MNVKAIKKTVILFLIFIRMKDAFCRPEENGNLHYLELKSQTAVSAPYNSESEKKVSADAGIKILMEGLDFRMYMSLPETAFSDFSEEHGFRNKLSLLELPKYGLGISMFQDSTPFNFKAGTISFSKSISRLRNPAPSTLASPLTRSFSFSCGTGASLPGISSSRQIPAASISIDFPFSFRDSKLTLQGYMTQEEETGILIGYITKPLSFLTVESCFTGARFYLQNDSSILKKNLCSFDPDWFYAGEMEFSIKSPLFKANLYTGVHQTPYNDYAFWFKTEARTSFRNFLLDLSYFAIPTSRTAPKAVPLTGGSSSICRTLEQWCINPQFILSFHDKNCSVFRTGISILNWWKISSTSRPEELHLMKIRGGACLENRIMSFKAEYTLSNLLLSGTPETASARPEKYHDVAVNYSFQCEKLVFSGSGDYKFYPPAGDGKSHKKVSSISFKATPDRKKLFTAGASLEMTYKDNGFHSGEAGGCLTFKSSAGKTKISAKAEISIPFRRNSA